jgi:predicted dithiol-disulfide oxidoreductase (DUF899 family)
MSDQPQPEQALPHPPIATEADWLKARLELLEQEKELTRQYDRVNAARRRLPMVKVEKDYRFTGPEGEVSLAELFQGKRQLIVYHFMFGPEQEAGCPGCTGYVNELGDLSLLAERDTQFVLVSRAPLAKLEQWKTQHGWQYPWYSSAGSDFNFDFDVSYTTESMQHRNIHNYRPRESAKEGELPGTSVFFRLGDDVYHTWSTYQRGTEGLESSYALLDTTPYGRQESFEDSPAGWPQKPTYG